MLEKLNKQLEEINIDNREELDNLIESININFENYDDWYNDIFSDNIDSLNMDRLPYLIDRLYVSNNMYKFMMCCMLIENTCEQLPFITNLENYPIFKEKYKLLKGTLLRVYNMLDNGIANCMAFIILNNDPKFELLTDLEKEFLTKTIIRKLNEIINYFTEITNIDNRVYNDIEIIVDLATYLNNREINQLVDKLSTFIMNYECKLFILKYRIVNNMNIYNMIDEMFANKDKINKLVYVLERIDAINLLPLDKIDEEDIARSNMIDWLKYPQELGKKPDSIEFLDKFEYDGYDFYVYKFKSNDFRIKDYMLGISGGYLKNKKTAIDTGFTFSNFEVVKEDYINQAKNIIDMIKEWNK